MDFHIPERLRQRLQDKPKSLLVFLGGLALGLFVFVPLAVFGLWQERVVLFLTGSAGIALTWLPAAFMGFLFAAGLYAGNYRNVHPAPWREQVW